jgi:fucose permease
LKIEETKLIKPPGLGTSLGLLKEPIFLFAIFGIFLYVGAESCMGRFLMPALAIGACAFALHQMDSRS